MISICIIVAALVFLLSKKNSLIVYNHLTSYIDNMLPIMENNTFLTFSCFTEPKAWD